MTLAELDAKIAELEALPVGVKSTQFGDRSTTFNTPEEKAAELAALRAERDSLAGTPRPRMWLLSGSKGV